MNYELINPGDKVATIQYCAKHFISIANNAIADHGYFAVALSGGSTPKAIFELLANKPYSKQINWKKVMLFWSDERAVPPHNPDSNFNMAMIAGFNKLPIPSIQIFRMRAETDIEKNALKYQTIIEEKLPNGIFDLVMLGMGDDGHTASLFPHTEGLLSREKLVVANYIPQLSTWRMTLTFDCINRARNIVIYVLGEKKAAMLQRILSAPSIPGTLPAQQLGTPANKALWIVDDAALPETKLLS